MDFDRRQRLNIALGGFVVFLGFMMLALAIIGAPGIKLVEFDFLAEHSELLVVVSAALGILDLIIGLLLSLSFKRRD